jgi:uncharacterized delta-60 repeat protein
MVRLRRHRTNNKFLVADFEGKRSLLEEIRMSRPSVIDERSSKVFQRVLAVGCGCSVLLASPAFAAPGGELDARFGENGRLRVTLADPALGFAVAQQGDGKLLIGGATLTAANGADFAIVRLNADGTRDIAFGPSGNGVATVDFLQFEDAAVSIAVQPDGKIIAAGWADMGTAFVDYDFAMARFNADGLLDNTFDGDGRVTLSVGGGDDSISGMVLLGNGQIVVAGMSDVNGDYDTVFARFNADGSLDTTFGTGGTGITLVDSASGTAHDQPFSMTQQPDGKFIACGLSAPAPYDATNGAMLAARANADGTVDTTYGNNGVALVQTATVLGTAVSCASLTDGSGATVLAGFDGDPGIADLALARLDANGNLVLTFGSAGQASIDLGGTDIVQSIIELSDGNLGLTGLTQTVDDNIPSDMYFAWIDPDTGMLDQSLGNNGVTIVDFGVADQPSEAEGLGLVQQLDSKLVAVGTSTNSLGPNSFAVARVDPLGAGSEGYAGFVETVATTGEGTPNLVLTVRRTGGSIGGPGPVTVAFTIVAGTAVAPADFTATSGVLEWTDGDMLPKTITIPITDDTTFETVETFTVILNNTSGGIRLAADMVRVSATDNDAAPPPPPPPPPSSGGGGGGGGASGLELLALLGLVNAFALRRRRGRGTTPSP